MHFVTDHVCLINVKTIDFKETEKDDLTKLGGMRSYLEAQNRISKSY